MREAISIAILAGGESRRFGGIDKQGLDFRGERLGRRAARNALTSGCPVIIVGTNRRPYDGLPVRFAEECFPGRGPLSGLHAALRVLETPWVYLTACDMPFFSLEWLDELIAGAARGGAQVVAARRGGFIEPFQALYARDLAERAASMLENHHEAPRKRSLANLIAQVSVLEVPESVAAACSPDGRIFLSANSPKELEYLQALE